MCDTVSDDQPSSRETLSNTAEQQSITSLPRIAELTHTCRKRSHFMYLLMKQSYAYQEVQFIYVKVIICMTYDGVVTTQNLTKTKKDM